MWKKRVCILHTLLFCLWGVITSSFVMHLMFKTAHIMSQLCHIPCAIMQPSDANNMKETPLYRRMCMKPKMNCMYVAGIDSPERLDGSFEKEKPEFTFSVKNTQVVFFITPLPLADGYEVYRSETPHGKYTLVAKGTTPDFEIYVHNCKSHYYKVRACHDRGEQEVYSDFSKPVPVNLVAAARMRKEKVDNFFKTIKDEVLTIKHIINN